MNSVERVFAALEGTSKDQTPFTLTMSLYGARLTNCPLPEYYTHATRYVAGQQAVMEWCQPDILFAPFALALEAASFGSELAFFSGSPPNVRKPSVRSSSEFLALTPPNPDSDPSLLYLRESVRLMADMVKGATPICAILAPPTDLPAIVLGIDQWIETLICNPVAAEQILGICEEHFVSMANQLLLDGADFVALPCMFINPKILFKQHIEAFIFPSLKRAFEQVKGPLVFHHGGNQILDNLAEYAALPQVAGMVLDQRDSLMEGRRILGPGRLLLGNLNGAQLNKARPERILAETQRILAEMKGDPSFIFASSGADIPWGTPPELIQTIAETVRGSG